MGRPSLWRSGSGNHHPSWCCWEAGHLLSCGRGGNSCHHGLMSDLVGDGVHELRGQGGQLDEGGAQALSMTRRSQGASGSTGHTSRLCSGVLNVHVHHDHRFHTLVGNPDDPWMAGGWWWCWPWWGSSFR